MTVIFLAENALLVVQLFVSVCLCLFFPFISLRQCTHICDFHKKNNVLNGDEDKM